MDRTLILVKPDAFARGLTGEIIARFERKGLKIVALKHMTVTEDLAKQHYAEHDGKPFFGELVEFITSGPLVAMVLEGDAGDHGRPPGHRRHEPARGHAGLDPRRLRHRGRPEHGPRVRLAGVGQARGRAVLPRPLVLASASPQRRAILEEVGVAVRGAAGRRRGGERGRPACGRPRERAPQGAARCPARLVLGADTIVALDGDILGKPRDAAQAREYVGTAERPHARGGGRDRAGPRRRDRGHGGRDHARDVPRVRRRDARRVRGDRRVGGARRRLRHPGRAAAARSTASTATTSTSSVCRWPRAERLLLAER